VTTSVYDAPAIDSSARQERLAGRVSRLRTRTGVGSLDRWLLLTGGVLIPLGFLVVIMGWIGASRTPLLFEQIPYMISGGLLGVVCMIAGGFCYFGYFLARLLSTSREMLDSLLRLEERFETIGLSASSPVDRSARLPLVPLVATKTGTMYHRPECTTIAGRSPAELRTVRATDGLAPCRMCIPAE
jgi:hypothetical protein